MASSFFKMANVNAEYEFIQALAPKSIQHVFEEKIDKSVPWVYVWHHVAEHNRFVYPYLTLTSDSYNVLYTPVYISEGRTLVQTSSALKPHVQSNPNFMWSLLGKGEQKFV